MRPRCWLSWEIIVLPMASSLAMPVINCTYPWIASPSVAICFCVSHAADLSNSLDFPLLMSMGFNESLCRLSKK